MSDWYIFEGYRDDNVVKIEKYNLLSYITAVSVSTDLMNEWNVDYIVGYLKNQLGDPKFIRTGDNILMSTSDIENFLTKEKRVNKAKTAVARKLLSNIIEEVKDRTNLGVELLGLCDSDPELFHKMVLFFDNVKKERR